MVARANFSEFVSRTPGAIRAILDLSENIGGGDFGIVADVISVRKAKL